jgi:hypothetical protein
LYDRKPPFQNIPSLDAHHSSWLGELPMLVRSGKFSRNSHFPSTLDVHQAQCGKCTYLKCEKVNELRQNVPFIDEPLGKIALTIKST